MFRGDAHAEALAYRRAGEMILGYLIRDSIGRDSTQPMGIAEGEALICLAGQHCVSLLGAGGDCEAAASERVFCRIADAEGWDDRVRDRLQHIVEHVLEQPQVPSAIAALVALHKMSGCSAGDIETKPVLQQHLATLSFEPSGFGATVAAVAWSRRRRRIGPGERPPLAQSRP
jgi:hypothetical protein